MMLLILLCNILFIPNIYSGNNTTINTIANPEKVLTQSSTAIKSYNEIPNQPKLMVSEGGSLLPDTFSSLLPKKNYIQSEVDKELGTKKDKPVARRNGVGDLRENNLAVKLNTPQLSNNDLTVPLMKNSANDAVATRIVNSEDSKIETKKISIDDKEKLLFESNKKAHDASKLKTLNVTQINNNINNSSSAVLNKIIHKKPTVLSFEALDKMDESQQSNIPAMKSSSKTLVNNQMPSPNEDSNKVYPKNASRHPGMIMPVVITILVVPMFAVLGYMALRRGQEAWKNRHYKRMDFLLDGMYND